MNKPIKPRTLAAFGGRVTRYWKNLNTFTPTQPGAVVMVRATYDGRKLSVTHAMKDPQ